MNVTADSETVPVVPQRIQLSRKRGWRKPNNTVVVSRPSRWGNPFKVGAVKLHGPMHLGGQIVVNDAAHAVKLYRRWLFTQQRSQDLVTELRGKNLACWCKIGAPCHADVLLEIANQ